MKNHLFIIFSYLLVLMLILVNSTPIAIGSNNPTLDILDSHKNFIFNKGIVPMFLEFGDYHSSVIYAVEQLPPDRESDENEPTTDLPIIDSPCQSSCPPNYKICIYVCN